MIMSKLHCAVKTEGAVAVGGSALLTACIVHPPVDVEPEDTGSTIT
jgi:hypothetical protein